MSRYLIRFGLLAVLGLSAAACSGKKDGDTPLEGQRISILSFEQNLQPDPQLNDMKIVLPPPYRNLNWVQSGGNAPKAMHHLEVGDALKQVWRKSIGHGSSSATPLVNPPIVVDGVLYVIDSKAKVTALNANSGDRIWEHELKVKDENDDLAFGGGLAYGQGRIFVSTGYGFVAALDSASGREIWRANINIPFRGAPSYADGRVFAVTHDNQTFAFSAENGEELWDHVGIVETAGVMGEAAPAIGGDTVIAAYSSGELFALRVENGRVAWTDTLSRTGRLTALASLNDVDGDPVIFEGMVYAMSHAGRMVAIDFASGNRVWENNIGGISTPWVAGDFIYAVTTDNELVCVVRRDGRVRWVKQLQRYTDPDDREGIIRWSGPILASDRLFLTSSHGYVITVSPYTGEILSGSKYGDGSFVAPIVANDTLYVETDDGEIVAYR